MNERMHPDDMRLRLASQFMSDWRKTQDERKSAFAALADADALMAAAQASPKKPAEVRKLEIQAQFAKHRIRELEDNVEFLRSCSSPKAPSNVGRVRELLEKTKQFTVPGGDTACYIKEALSLLAEGEGPEAVELFDAGYGPKPAGVVISHLKGQLAGKDRTIASVTQARDECYTKLGEEQTEHARQTNAMATLINEELQLKARLAERNAEIERLKVEIDGCNQACLELNQWISRHKLAADKLLEAANCVKHSMVFHVEPSLGKPMLLKAITAYEDAKADGGEKESGDG